MLINISIYESQNLIINHIIHNYIEYINGIKKIKNNQEQTSVDAAFRLFVNKTPSSGQILHC